MMVSYKAAIAHVAHDYIIDDVVADAQSREIEILSFVYGVRPQRIVADIDKARVILDDGE